MGGKLRSCGDSFPLKNYLLWNVMNVWADNTDIQLHQKFSIILYQSYRVRGVRMSVSLCLLTSFRVYFIFVIERNRL